MAKRSGTKPHVFFSWRIQLVKSSSSTWELDSIIGACSTRINTNRVNESSNVEDMDGQEILRLRDSARKSG